MAPIDPGATLTSANQAGPCTTSELAKLLDLDRRTIQLWRLSGCPTLPDGRFDPVAVAKWRDDRDGRRKLTGRRNANRARIRAQLQAQADPTAAGAAVDDVSETEAELLEEHEDDLRWRFRWERARALTLESTLAERDGRLIERAEVARLFAARCALLRREAQAFVQRLAPQLVGLQTPAEIAAIAGGFVREILERYSASDDPLLRRRRRRGDSS